MPRQAALQISLRCRFYLTNTYTTAIIKLNVLMWTIESEICKLASKANIRSALFQLKLLTDEDDRFELREIHEWKRLGAETYIYRFELCRNHIDVRQFILKACVAWSPTLGLESILASWIERRKMLSAEGIATPWLVGWGEGVILEEYIPLTLREQITDIRYQQSLLYQLANYAGVLARLGFLSIDAFTDLRSRGSDVVAIDFGEDLGPPHVRDWTQEQDYWFQRLLAISKTWTTNVSDEESRHLWSIYNSHFKTLPPMPS